MYVCNTCTYEHIYMYICNIVTNQRVSRTGPPPTSRSISLYYKHTRYAHTHINKLHLAPEPK